MKSRRGSGLLVLSALATSLGPACAPTEVRAFEVVRDLRADLAHRTSQLVLVRGNNGRALAQEMRATMWTRTEVRQALRPFTRWLDVNTSQPVRVADETTLHGLGAWALLGDRMIGELRGFADAGSLTSWLQTVASSTPALRKLQGAEEAWPPTDRPAEQSLDLANLLSRNGAVEPARRLVQAVLDAVTQPSTTGTRALLLAGALRLDLGQVQAAGDALDQLPPAIAPNLEPTRQLLRACCLRAGAKPSAAVPQLRAWLERYVDHVDRDRARFELASALRDSGRTTEAIAMLQHLRTEHPESRFTRTARQLMLDWVENADAHHGRRRSRPPTEPR